MCATSGGAVSGEAGTIERMGGARTVAAGNATSPHRPVEMQPLLFTEAEGRSEAVDSVYNGGGQIWDVKLISWRLGARAI